jgi:hypothetical protein
MVYEGTRRCPKPALGSTLRRAGKRDKGISI